MKKHQFLDTLKSELSPLSKEEVQDILRDQSEYIDEAIRAGRLEDAVIRSLGNPKDFALNLLTETKIKNAEQSSKLGTQVKLTVSAVFAILALAPLNLIFVLGPFLAIVACLFAGWTTSVAVFLCAVIFIFVFLFKLIFIPIGFWLQLSMILFLIGWVAGSLLAFNLMSLITKLLTKGTLSYLRWNFDFIKNQR